MSDGQVNIQINFTKAYEGEVDLDVDLTGERMALSALPCNRWLSPLKR